VLIGRDKQDVDEREIEKKKMLLNKVKKKKKK
jgi:hypothetical protein